MEGGAEGESGMEGGWRGEPVRVVLRRMWESEYRRWIGVVAFCHNESAQARRPVKFGLELQSMLQHRTEDQLKFATRHGAVVGRSTGVEERR
jgi:hypothetical protein